MKNTLIYFFITLLYTSAVTAQGIAAGTRIDLTSKLNLDSGAGQFAQLFVPDYFTPAADGKYLLVFHFHSASWAAEDEVYKSNANAVLFNIHLGGLSSPYQNYFINSNRFQIILDTLNSVLQNEGIILSPEIEKLIITTFSAGYAGVREILKKDTYYNLIDAINLADGLHSSSDSSSMHIQMSDFLRFAKDARDGKKIMILTHSSIPTSGYASTTETSNYLIHFIGAQRVPYSAFDAIGTQYSKCDTGNFHLKGYLGTTAGDHLKHLYNMHLMLIKALELLYPTTKLKEHKSSNDKSYNLFQNYPNPFNLQTTISFTAALPGKINISLFNINGEKVKTLLNSNISGGNHSVVWNGTDNNDQPLSSGVYFYKMKSGSFSKIEKAVLLK